MNQFCKKIVLAASAVVGLVALSACGGGGDSSSQLASQTISFTSPGDQVFGAAPAALIASSTSGLSVAFRSLTLDICTVDGATLTMAAAGSCTVIASQTGDATYAAAVPVRQTLSVAPAAQTISFISPGNQSLGAPTAPLVATVQSGLPVSFSSSTTIVCAVSGTTLTLLTAGQCIVNANQAGDANHAAAPTVSNSFAVSATALQAQTITFTPPGDQILGTAPAALAATSTSGLPVSFASTTLAVCTVSGNTLTLVTAGTCTVAASQAGNGTYAAAALVQQNFPVAPTPQTITFASPGNQTFGSAPIALVATSSSGLTVTLASTTLGVCTVSGTNLTLLSAGACSVTASQAGNANVAAATPVLRSFTVAQAAQTITFATPGNQTFGSAPITLVATSSSGLPVSFASTTPGVCAVSGTTLSLLNAGACTVTASQAGNANFAAATSVPGSFTVASAAQTISFTSPGNQTLGTAPPPLVATATSGLQVVFSSSTPNVCAVNGTALTLLIAGQCTVNANQAGDANHAAAPAVTNSFVVSAAPLLAQTITFASPGNQTFGSAPIALVATSSSGLTVTLASTTPGACTVSGTSLTLLSAGTCSVNASQDGNLTFAAATPVLRSFTVAPAAQTIAFTVPGDQTLGTAPPSLVATATSGLLVSFASTTPAVCTVSGTALTLVAVGSCTVVASQAGNANYSAATNVPGTFNVAAAPLTPQTINFPLPGSQTVGVPFSLVATATSGLTVSFSSNTTSVCTVSGTVLTLVSAGSCIVVASQAGNITYAAAPVVSNTFAVLAAPELVADGGFETPAIVVGQFAQGWVGASGIPATLSNDAHTGLHSASLAIPDPGLNGSGLFQNSVDNGGLPSVLGLYVGKHTVLTFWAKGNQSFTGNVNFSLRYLNANGNILNTVVNTNFGSLINANTWTKITYNGPAIPATTSAIFLEMTLAVGPTGVQPPGNCGVDPNNVPLPCDYGQAQVLVDDVSVIVVP